MFEISSISVFHGKTLAVDSASAVFPESEVTHILGRNGSGKSTLAKALAGVLPFEGRIHPYMGEAVVIGSYSNIPLDVPVGTILAVARKRSSGNAFWMLYDHLEISSLPQKRLVSRLSDGQRQKLKLIFFLAPCPHLVVLDECTNFLDRNSAEKVLAFFEHYAKEREAVVVNITHDVSDVKRAPGMCYLMDGGIMSGPYSAEVATSLYLGEYGNAARVSSKFF